MEGKSQKTSQVVENASQTDKKITSVPVGSKPNEDVDLNNDGQQSARKVGDSNGKSTRARKSDYEDRRKSKKQRMASLPDKWVCFKENLTN